MDSDDGDRVSHPPDTVYVTAGLLEVLLSFAAEADPTTRSIALVASPVADLSPTDDDGAALDGLAPDAAVFTDLVFPDVGSSVNYVFGMALSVPPGRTHGRFVSHPARGPELDQRDDIAARVLVAVPPWEPENVRAYDRRGRRLELVVLDAAPPEGSLPTD